MILNREDEVGVLVGFEDQFRDVRLNNAVVYDAMELEREGSSTEVCLKIAIIRLSNTVTTGPTVR